MGKKLAPLASAAEIGQPERLVPPEFPFTPVRDLIGILRVLYAKELERKVPRKGRLAAIKKIAEELQRSIRIAATHDPGTARTRRRFC